MSLQEKIEIQLVDPNQSKVYQGQDVEVHALITLGEKQPPIPDDTDAGKKDLLTYKYEWSAHFGPYPAQVEIKDKLRPWEATLQTDGVEFGTYSVALTLRKAGDEKVQEVSGLVEVRPPPTLRGSGPVTLGRSSVAETKDVALWQGIRHATQDMAFAKYDAFIKAVMTGGALDPASDKALKQIRAGRLSPVPGVSLYQLLKTATEVFVKLNCQVLDSYNFNDPEAIADYNGRHDRDRDANDLNRLWDRYLVKLNGVDPATETLPYLALIRRKFGDQSIVRENPQLNSTLDAIDGLLQEKLTRPCFFELIWSYWHEEGMLVQTLNAITVRFQNQRTSARDPLANFMTAPLHTISPILFEYIQDEQHRLTVARRAYEYDHQYGFTLHGKAVPELRAADSRSKFLEAFHNLLSACVTFYKQDDNTTIIADGFQILNGLKEVHLLLAEGAHNQFGDLPATARTEMLMQQWILARTEIREFIGGRPMVPYAEAWMDRVDGMKKLQGWSDVTITYYNDLARFGEQLLLSIRYGSWSELHEPRSATNWAREWRAEVKQYIHAYRAVTGVDLALDAPESAATDRNAPPSVHLRRRLELQKAQRPAMEPVAAPQRAQVGRNGGNGSAPAHDRMRTSRQEIEMPEKY